MHFAHIMYRIEIEHVDKSIFVLKLNASNDNLMDLIRSLAERRFQQHIGGTKATALAKNN